MSEARSYVEAWLAREPGMELAQVFVAAPSRELFALWGALQHQLDEAAFELRDASVARAKLSWWAEELATMAAQSSRHPLARALSAHEAVRAVPTPDWHALVHGAMLAAASEHAPADVDALLAQGAPYARVTARIEARVLAPDPHAPLPQRASAASAGARMESGGLAPDPGATREPHDARAAQAVAVHQLLRRLEHSLGRDAAQFPWPMNLRARHQAAPEAFADVDASPAARAALADLASELERRVAGLRGATLFRRCQAALDAQRLRLLARGRSGRVRANGAATLWTLWRAARRGA